MKKADLLNMKYVGTADLSGKDIEVLDRIFALNLENKDGPEMIQILTELIVDAKVLNLELRKLLLHLIQNGARWPGANG